MKGNNLTEKESNILKAVLEYLEKIEDDSSILKGNLLKDEGKEFIYNNVNAFIIGLIADQSVNASVAWSLPYKLSKRIGYFDFNRILKEYNEEDLEGLIRQNKALHRYPKKMANYIYSAIYDIVNKYDSNASNIWKGQSAASIVSNLEKFKGISHKKASLGTLILVRDMNVNILDKENIDIAYDIHIRRLFLRLGLVDCDNQKEIIEEAKKLYPSFPGKLTTAFWNLGRTFCFPTNPLCLKCPLCNLCCKAIDKSKNVK